MAKNIAEYKKKEKDTFPYFMYSRYRRNLCVTAYVSNGGRGVQFTIGSNFIDLSESQTKHLIRVLEKRIAGENAYDATHPDIPERVQIPVKANLNTKGSPENCYLGLYDKDKEKKIKEPFFTIQIKYHIDDMGQKYSRICLTFSLSDETDYLHKMFRNPNTQIFERSLTKYWGTIGDNNEGTFATEKIEGDEWDILEETTAERAEQIKEKVFKVIRENKEVKEERKYKPPKVRNAFKVSEVE